MYDDYIESFKDMTLKSYPIKVRDKMSNNVNGEKGKKRVKTLEIHIPKSVGAERICDLMEKFINLTKDKLIHTKNSN